MKDLIKTTEETLKAASIQEAPDTDMKELNRVLDDLNKIYRRSGRIIKDPDIKKMLNTKLEEVIGDVEDALYELDADQNIP